MDKQFGRSWLAEKLNGSHKQWIYLSWLMKTKQKPTNAEIGKCLSELGLFVEGESIVSVTPTLRALFQIQMCLLMTHFSDEYYLEFTLPRKAQELGLIDLQIDFGIID